MAREVPAYVVREIDLSLRARSASDARKSAAR
jgi:hypothetical protein